MAGQGGIEVPKSIRDKVSLMLEPQNKKAAKWVQENMGLSAKNYRTTMRCWVGEEKTTHGYSKRIKGKARLDLLKNLLKQVELKEAPKPKAPVEKINGTHPLRQLEDVVATVKRLSTEIESLRSVNETQRKAMIRFESILKSELKQRNEKIDALLEALK